MKVLSKPNITDKNPHNEVGQKTEQTNRQNAELQNI